MASLAVMMIPILAGSAPSGGSADPASVCSSEGGVQAQEAWNYAAQPGWRIFFQGVADSAGNLYWAECSAQWVCDIVSSSSNGVIRFRTPLRNVRPRARFERGQLVALGDLVIEAIEPDRVRALRSSDGSEVWSRALGASLCQGSPSGIASPLNLHSITAGRDGEVFLEAHGDPCGTRTRSHWIVSLSISNGAVRWSKGFERSPSELVADEQGALFFRAELPTDGRWRRTYLVSLSSDGQEQWRTEVSWSSLPVATAKGWLFDAERKVWRTSTGAIAFQLPLEPVWGGQRNAFTMIDEDSAFVIASPKRQCPGPECSLKLHRVDLAAGKIAWSVVLADSDHTSITAPVLTSERTILFAQSGDCSALREFSTDGKEIRSDGLPTGRYRSGAALVANLWIAAVGSTRLAHIRAFDTEGSPASRGWNSWCGDQGCAGRPQEEQRRAVAARRPPRR